MSSNNEIFRQVEAAVDIVEIIGEHVALKRAGSEFKGLCPFHPDHRPSMGVNPRKQIFHCFVCGTGGNVFKFVTLYHKMTNGEALKMLAQRAGIKLPELPNSRGGPKEEGPSIREQIANTNEWACAFFEKNLRTPPGAEGLNYFHSRGLTDETIAKFRLGWSLSWTDIINAALRLGTPASKLKDAGLTKDRNDGSPYAVFRDRVIFPIIDATGGKSSDGRVIAFGGRILEEKRDAQGIVTEPKYLNTPETRLFTKGESVYGLNLARQQIIRTRTAIIVEGYMDVIACHQAGVTNVIATLGTALTQEHARLLKNYAQTIVLVFDSDDAGFRAADRAMEVFVKTQLDIKLTNVPNGKDPCDFCLSRNAGIPPAPGGLSPGGEAFQKLIDAAPDALTYQWQRLQKQFRATESLSAKQESITHFMRFVAAGLETAGANGQNIWTPVRRGLLFSKLANLVGLHIDEVAAALKKAGAESANRRRAEPANPDPSATSDSPDRPLAPSPIHIPTLTGLDAAEALVLGSLLAQPPLYEKARDEISLSLFLLFRPLAMLLFEHLENHADLPACTLSEILSELEARWASDELSRQAIQLERRTSDFLDPQMSPMHVKMLAQSRGDRGLTLELIMRESLKQLRSARGDEDPGLTADLDGPAPTPTPASEEESKLADLKSFLERKSRHGPDRSNIGLGR